MAGLAMSSITVFVKERFHWKFMDNFGFYEKLPGIQVASEDIGTKDNVFIAKSTCSSINDPDSNDATKE